jgi:epoxyqueuosine reductase
MLRHERAAQKSSLGRENVPSGGQLGPMTMKQAIRKRALELGFDACGFTTAASPATAPQFRAWLEDGHEATMSWLARSAHRRSDPQQVLPGAQSIVVLSAAYCGPTASPPPAGEGRTGLIAAYARHTDYHEVLGERLQRLTTFIQQLGGDATRSQWYTDTGPILERDVAQRAGLGFIGKHTNLISRTQGNWLLLAEILTTLRLEPDESERNRCGTCSRCLSACPTQAIVAPFRLDARRCISYLTIELKGSIPLSLRSLVENRIFGCDDCLAACPWNRFAREGALMRPYTRADLSAPDLLELLALDEAGFRSRFVATPILRAKRRGLLRNVCVALGNVGDASALPALMKAGEETDPLIAEHARWAAAQIRQQAGPR